MDYASAAVIKGLIILVALWLGVAVTAGTVLLLESYKRRFSESHTVAIPCPMCDGQGVVIIVGENGTSELDHCPLCDGESGLIEEVPALERGES